MSSNSNIAAIVIVIKTLGQFPKELIAKTAGLNEDQIHVVEAIKSTVADFNQPPKEAAWNNEIKEAVAEVNQLVATNEKVEIIVFLGSSIAPIPLLTGQLFDLTRLSNKVSIYSEFRGVMNVYPLKAASKTKGSSPSSTSAELEAAVSKNFEFTRLFNKEEHCDKIVIQLLNQRSFALQPNQIDAIKTTLGLTEKSEIIQVLPVNATFALTDANAQEVFEELREIVNIPAGMSSSLENIYIVNGCPAAVGFALGGLFAKPNLFKKVTQVNYKAPAGYIIYNRDAVETVNDEMKE